MTIALTAAAIAALVLTTAAGHHARRTPPTGTPPVTPAGNTAVIRRPAAAHPRGRRVPRTPARVTPTPGPRTLPVTPPASRPGHGKQKGDKGKGGPGTKPTDR